MVSMFAKSLWQRMFSNVPARLSWGTLRMGPGDSASAGLVGESATFKYLIYILMNRWRVWVEERCPPLARPRGEISVMPWCTGHGYMQCVDICFIIIYAGTRPWTGTDPAWTSPRRCRPSTSPPAPSCPISPLTRCSRSLPSKWIRFNRIIGKSTHNSVVMRDRWSLKTDLLKRKQDHQMLRTRWR